MGKIEIVQIVFSVFVFICGYLIVSELIFPDTNSETQQNNLPPASSNQNSANSYSMSPYEKAYCDKINPYDLQIRKYAADAVREHPGSYNIDQVLDIYDWVKNNIIYLNVPVNLENAPYYPNETLITKSGDCKNQAVLLSSMINSIGGSSKVVLSPDCLHAYTIVYFTNITEDFNDLTKTINLRYPESGSTHYYEVDGGYWMIFDTAGGLYPGDTLPECLNKTNTYTVSSCVYK